MTREEYDIAVNEYSGRLFRFVVKYLKDDEDAHDVVQDSFEKLWRNREKVLPNKAKSWLFTTANNVLINLAKKKKRTQRMEEGHPGPIVASEGKRIAAKEVLEMALERLPEQQRSILLLRDLEGYNYKEIGEILELSESQVKVYLFRARQKVKSLIKDLSF